MKKLFAMLLCLAVLLLAGCSSAQPTATEAPTQSAEPVQTQPPTTLPVQTEPVETEPVETEPPVPETITGTALANGTAVVLMTVDRDAVLDIVGEFDDDHYVVKLESGYGLIEKRLVRLSGAEAYTQWNGYARPGAKLYSNYHLLVTEELQELSMNTQFVVLDSLEDCLVVQMGDVIGYMLQSETSRSYIQYTPGSGGGQDGGDISLDYQGGYAFLSAVAPQSGDVTGSAVVLANEAEILLGWYDRGEFPQIVTQEGFGEEKEGWYLLYVDGLYGYAQENLIALEGAEPYAEWDAYTRYQAVIYGNYYLTGEPIANPSANTVIRILQDLDVCYVVSIGDQIGYIAKEQVSETYITYGGGGGGGEWTDPVM